MQDATAIDPVAAHAGDEPMASISREQFEQLQAQLKFAQTQIAALNFEIARLKRWRFGSSSERPGQTGAAVRCDPGRHGAGGPGRARGEVQAGRRRCAEEAPPGAPGVARGATARGASPRTARDAVRLRPAAAAHREDVSEQLDCVPAQFFVHRHIRGKYACRCCQTIRAAALPAQIIDKGLPAPGLLAQVVAAKHDDHLPLYRQQEIYARSGVHIARSSMAQWVGTCGVRLAPLADALREHILGHHPRRRDAGGAAGAGQGQDAPGLCLGLPHDDVCAQAGGVVRLLHRPRRRASSARARRLRRHRGHRRLLGLQGRVRPGQDHRGRLHGRRKLYEAHELNGSQIAGHAVTLMARLYVIERDLKELENVDAATRRRIRQERARPVRTNCANG